jgi:hypothetical protein
MLRNYTFRAKIGILAAVAIIALLLTDRYTNILIAENKPIYIAGMISIAVPIFLLLLDFIVQGKTSKESKSMVMFGRFLMIIVLLLGLLLAFPNLISYIEDFLPYEFFYVAVAGYALVILLVLILFRAKPGDSGGLLGK